MSQIFDFSETKAKINANTISNFNGEYPYVTRSEKNNGIQGYITYPKKYLNDANTISLGMDTATFFYQKDPYFTGDKIKILSLINKEVNLKTVHPYLLTSIKKAFSSFGWGTNSYDSDTLKSVIIKLPVKSDNDLEPDWKYMEDYVKNITPNYLDVIKNQGKIQINKIQNKQSGIAKLLNITECELSREEINLVNQFPHKNWKEIPVKKIFDVIERGKRLIEAQRLSGTLPFVTAGVNNQGISSYISNPEVKVFPANSLTIDMFGKVFYRDFNYGADDHVAVLAKADNSLSKETLLFIAPIIEKAIRGQFDYSQNFYASDVYDIVIKLPHLYDKIPDYRYMEDFSKIMVKKTIQHYEQEIARHEQEIALIISNFLENL
ncbi:restriction endonuclease subunit S [Streptococcus anginosus]|nr:MULTISPECIES: restriction endonuclease subunit S [Streptococcus]MCY7212063.1 restriction endonuclease subunit S [Streptococcus anginosus]MCY7225961.1 restriction endonuclease subunit S [Streptococcus anginosus]MDU5127966.1 restriction endonuclease subunit S [Streptococcus anginosus]MEE0846260.1 restriction endonuclease subunit S [Streptococcus anginosus]